MSLTGLLVTIGIGAVLGGVDSYLTQRATLGATGRIQWGEVAEEALISGAIAGVLYPLAFVKYLRAVLAGVGLSSGFAGTWDAYYVQHNTTLAYFRGAVTSVAALTIVNSALQSGTIGRSTPGLMQQVRAAAGSLGIRANQTAVCAEDVSLLKAAMATGEFEYTASRGRIAGWKLPDGTYIINEGTNRMTAALQIFAETGDRGPVDSLLQNGLWETNNAPSGGAWPTNLTKPSQSDKW